MKVYTASRVLNIGLLFSFLFVQSEPYFSNEFKHSHYENSYDSGKSAQRAKVPFDCVDSEGMGPRNSVGVSFAAHSDTVVKQLNMQYASPMAREYIHNCLLQLQQGIRYVVMGHHYGVLKGYCGGKGLQSLLPDFVATNKADGACVDDYSNRFQSYINCVENIVFDGSCCFKEVISETDKEQLAWAYALFVEEFSLGDARAEMRNLAKSDPVFASVYKQMVNPGWVDKVKNIVWSFFGGNDYYCRQSVSAARDAATGHGALGQMYRLIEEKKFDKARDLLDKQIAYKKWFWGRTVWQSLHEKYTIVEKMVLSVSEQQVLRENVAQEAIVIQNNPLCVDSAREYSVVENRLDVCSDIEKNPELLKCVFVNVATIVPGIDKKMLDADGKSITLIGHKLQLQYMCESLTILDRVHVLECSSLYDKRLDPLADATKDCSNASIRFNKDGQTMKALRAVDTGWVFLDCLATGVNYLANSAKTVGVRVAMPALRGVDKGVRRCANMVLHPVKTVGDFVDSVAVCTKYVSLAALEMDNIDTKIAMELFSDAGSIDDIEELISKYAPITEAVSDQVQAITLEQGVEEAVAFGVEALFLHGVGKFCSFVNKNVPTIIKDVAEGVKASEVLMTAEGVPVRVASEIGNVKDSFTKINQACVAILKDGYYEVNGFKFTEYYYNRLWNNGRGAPSLAAKAILENSTKIIPDPRQMPGFFKYFAEGWEMIYNPTTKVVSHIQPIKRF